MNPGYAYVKNTRVYIILLNILGLLEVSFTTIQMKCWPVPMDYDCTTLLLIVIY